VWGFQNGFVKSDPKKASVRDKRGDATGKPTKSFFAELARIGQLMVVFCYSIGQYDGAIVKAVETAQIQGSAYCVADRQRGL
jgi:hypothetical protein